MYVDGIMIQHDRPQAQERLLRIIFMLTPRAWSSKYNLKEQLLLCYQGIAKSCLTSLAIESDTPEA